jgi:ankyrin repeat protein
MRTKFIIFSILTFLLFSCKSTPPYNLLDWNRTKFKPKDGKLFVAIKYGTNMDVQAALKDSPDINVADYLEQTAFMWACRNGNLDIINELLNYDKTNIEKKTKKYKRLDIKAKSIPRNPELQYNALFCYIMSKSINPADQTAKDTLTKIVNIDKSILDMTDWYGETVIHKMVRSNNNYFEVIAKELDEQKKKDIINKKSMKYQQSPLMLAIELGNSWMIDALVKDGINNEITDINLPILAFNRGNGDIEVFLSIYKGRMIYDKNSQARVRNEQLENEIDECLKRPSNASYRAKINYFLQIYNNYRNELIIKPDDLEPEEYVREKKNVFNMLQKKMTMAEKNTFYENIRHFPTAINLWDDEDEMKRTLLQLVIEKQEFDVFEWIIRNNSLEKIVLPNNGTGDYLTIAMLKRNKEVMNFLLNENEFIRYNIENLMQPTNTRIAKELAFETFGKNEMDPLVLFCTDSDLSEDRNLLTRIAKFYRSKYSQPEYCFKLLEELERNDLFSNYEFFLDNYGTYFYEVNTLHGEPVIGVLLDKEEKKLVQKYIMKKKEQLDYANEQALYTRKNGYLDLWELYEEIKKPPEPPSNIQKMPNQSLNNQNRK